MCSWKADIMMVQEARLGEEAQRIMAVRIAKDKKVPIWGTPMPLKENRNKTKEGRVNATIWDAQQGGLACICEPAIPVQRVEVHDSAYHMVEERRMEHFYVPCGEGGWGFHVLNLYAAASAENEVLRTRLNEQLYRDVSQYVLGMGNVPIFVVGDWNPTEENDRTMGEILRARKLRDVFSEWTGGAPGNTYCRHGTYQGMFGKGVTRPDRIYANQAAYLLIREANTLYLHDNPSHAVLELKLNTRAFLSLHRTLKAPMNFCRKLLLGEAGYQQVRSWEEQAWNEGQVGHYEEALREGLFTRALQLWTHAAEDFLVLQIRQIHGDAVLDTEMETKHRGRGADPVFRMAHLTATTQRRMPTEGATNARITQLSRAERRASQYLAKWKFLQREGWQGNSCLQANAELETLATALNAFLFQEGRRSRGGGQVH